MSNNDESERVTPRYWLPEWWEWMSDWSQCITCLKYNHSSCVSCEIPPGFLGLAQLVGGGTATVAGIMRGNVGIHNQKQAQAATRVSCTEKVNRQLHRQHQININVNNVNRNDLKRNYDR